MSTRSIPEAERTIIVPEHIVKTGAGDGSDVGALKCWLLTLPYGIGARTRRLELERERLVQVAVRERDRARELEVDIQVARFELEEARKQLRQLESHVCFCREREIAELRAEVAASRKHAENVQGAFDDYEARVKRRY